MVKFWMTAFAFIASCSTASCGKNSISADADAKADADTDTEIGITADADAGADSDADAGADASIDTAEDDGDASEDASDPAYPDIAGVWTMTGRSNTTGGNNFYLNYSLFQDGMLVRGVEKESEDAYCHGSVGSDGLISLTMEEPCTGSTVTFTGAVTSSTFMSGRYFWEWTDAYGAPHHDDGVWYASPFFERCSPCPSVAGDWALTYLDGRTEYETLTIKQTKNAIRGLALDGCEYLGAIGLTSECDDLRIYRRCPALAGQTQVLFGLLDNPGQMSGSWETVNDTFSCPEIRNGSWSADRL